MESLSDIKKGDKVYFGRSHGEQTLGEVVKVNRVKVKVRQLESRGMYKSHSVGTVWTVPVSLLVKADPATAVPKVMPVEVQNRLRANQDRDFEFMTGKRADAPVFPPMRNRRPEAEIMFEIRRLYSRLSPENLHCDGEISRSAAARKAVELNKRLRACFAEMGRTVSEGEAFKF